MPSPLSSYMTLLLACVMLCGSGCELVANFDRDDIPKPGLQIPDATVFPPGPVIEAGLPDIDGGMDAGMDASTGMDAMVDGGEDDAGDEDGGM